MLQDPGEEEMSEGDGYMPDFLLNLEHFHSLLMTGAGRGGLSLTLNANADKEHKFLLPTGICYTTIYFL